MNVSCNKNESNKDKNEILVVKMKADILCTPNAYETFHQPVPGRLFKKQKMWWERIGI